jgi:N-acetylneuraminic acid mutarotase
MYKKHHYPRYQPERKSTYECCYFKAGICTFGKFCKYQHTNVSNQCHFREKCWRGHYKRNSTVQTTIQNNSDNYIPPIIDVPEKCHSVLLLKNKTLVGFNARKTVKISKMGNFPTKKLPSFTTVYLLDATTKTVRYSKTECSGTLPTPRKNYTLCKALKDSKLVLFGGFTGGDKREPEGYCNDVYELDTEKWSWVLKKCVGDPPSPRCSHAAVTNRNGTTMYVFGGMNSPYTSTVVYLNDLFKLNIKSYEWNEIECYGDLPNGVMLHGLALDEKRNRLFVVGGYTLSETLYELDSYSHMIPTSAALKIYPPLYVLNLHNHMWTKVELTSNVSPELDVQYRCFVFEDKLLAYTTLPTVKGYNFLELNLKDKKLQWTDANYLGRFREKPVLFGGVLSNDGYLELVGIEKFGNVYWADLSKRTIFAKKSLVNELTSFADLQFKFVNCVV